METKVPSGTDARESDAAHAIGWETGVDGGGPWIGLCRRTGDKVVPLERTYPADPAHPLTALGYLLDDAVMYVGDPDDRATSIDPIPGAVLATLGQPLYTAPLELRADQLDVGWLIPDASDESTWRTVEAVVECEDASCEIEDCTVVVSQAYRDGFAHFPSDFPGTARIPAGDA